MYKTIFKQICPKKYNNYLSEILSESKHSMRLTLPLIVIGASHALSGFVTTIMVARLGEKELAANALVWAIYLAAILLCTGIISSVSIMASHSFGAKDDNGVGFCFKQGMVIAIMLMLPTMIIMYYAPIILVLTKQSPVVVDLAKPFFQSLMWLMPFVVVALVVDQFLIGIGKMHTVIFIRILLLPTQIFFCYSFLLGRFGFPKFGLPGIGYSLTISFCLMVIYYFFHLSFSKYFKKYCLFHKWWIIDRQFLLELIRIGLPLGLMLCIELSLFAIIAFMMGALSTASLAAYQIAYQYSVIALVAILSVAQTVTIRVGNEAGRNNHGRLKLTIKVNLGISLGITSLFSIFYIIFPQLAIELGINTHALHLQGLVKEASAFLSAAGVFILIENIRLINLGSLRGLKDTLFLMIISAFGFWCIVFPVSYMLAFKLKFGGLGIWYGLIIGVLIVGIILFIRFNRLIKHVNLVSLVTRPG